MHINLTEKQSQIFLSTANEIFAGGSASGGKTFVNKVLAIAVAEAVPGAQIAILRNTSKNLKKNYMMGVNSMPMLLSDGIKQKKVKINYQDGVIEWDTGSAIHLMHAEHVETTIENLTGLEFCLIIVDEAALISQDIINHAKSRLRLGALKVNDPFWKDRLPRLQMTSNPGGISHSFLKKNYIDPSPPGKEFTDENGTKRLFIPFGARENPYIDYESYERQLKSMGDPIKYKQLAEGDWDASASTFFGDAFTREHNVVPDFEIPKSWRIVRGYDPGFSSPFGYVLLAYVKGDNEVYAQGKRLYFPNGSIIVYREWYGYDGKDINIGLRWTHSEVAEGIREREINWGLKNRIVPGRADWKIWDGELNVYSEYDKRGIRFVKADKVKGSRVAGALKMRELLFSAHDENKEKPGLYFVDKCVHSIATIPMLPTDPNNTDDVVTEGVPDHLYDAIRYNIASVTKQVGIAKVTGL